MVLSVIAVVTLLLTSAVSLLSTQHQININNQVNFLSTADCRNALHRVRLWLMQTADKPPTPTIDGAYDIWQHSVDEPPVNSAQWWQHKTSTLSGKDLSLMPQIGTSGVYIKQLASPAHEAFRAYKISTRCQTNQAAITAMMEASVYIAYPSQTLLPALDWQMK